MKTLLNLTVAVCSALIISASSVMAQTQGGNSVYHSDPLVVSNLWITALPTNLPPAAYAVNSNPNVPIPGNGLFQVSDIQPLYATAPGVTYQLIYTQTSVTNQNLSPIGPAVGLNTNLIATFALLLDDATLKDLGLFSNSIAAVTNMPTFTVTFPLSASATNSITNGFSISMAQGSITNTLGAKWAKLINLSAPGYSDGLYIRSLRAGYYP